MKNKILIVEDERIIAEDIKVNLENIGCEVVGIVNSGESAIKESSEKHPALTLMDIILHGNMTGIEAGRIINKNLDIPVVYITAHKDEEILEEAKITEPFSFLVKPFDNRELKSTIEISLYKHKMGEKIKKKEKIFRELVENISDVIYEIDNNGKIKYISSVIESMTGYKTAQLVGKRFCDYVSPGDISITKRYLNDALSGKNGPIEFRLISRFGDPIWIRTQLRSSSINGKSKELFGVLRDITEHKRLEKEFLKSQKLESVTFLAWSIAHSFSNLMTAILGNVSLAKNYVNNDNKLYRFLNDIETASLRAKDLTTQLLIFSEGGTPVKKSVSLSELIESSVELVLGGSNVFCQFSISDNIWNVKVDREQVNQVFNNILINAAQSMPDGGNIKISAQNLILGKDNEFSLKQRKYVKIIFKDYGTGIAPEHLSKVFEPYFSTKKKRSGLGLSVASTVIKNHEGFISVDSELGEGTTIKIYIPADNEDNKNHKQKKRVSDKCTGNVLVMDDEKIVRDTVGMMLKSLGFSVEIAPDGKEAIEKYEKVMGTKNSFDAVIIDLTVPGRMGGLKTVEYLRKIDPEIKAIVSSGYYNNQIMSNYKQYGFDSVIAKPYTVQELKEILENILK